MIVRRIASQLAEAAGIAIAAALGLPPMVAVALPVAGLAALPAGSISTVAGGPGGPDRATLVSLRSDCGPVQYAAGHLYIADSGGYIRTVNTRTDWLLTPVGPVLASERGGGVPARRAQLSSPCAATRDAAGNVVVADQGAGKILVVAARSGRFYGRAMKAGYLYTVVKGGIGCQVTDAFVTGTFCPDDVVTDHNGNIVLSNAGTLDPRGRPTPQILVLAARTGTFYREKMQAGQMYFLADGAGAELAVDGAGNILLTSGVDIAVLAEHTGRLYGLRMRAGTIYRIAGDNKEGYSGDGGPARQARLGLPQGVAVDHHGNVLIADTSNSRIRVVAEHTGRFYGKPMTAGDIYTVAGSASARTGNGVPAIRARLVNPTSVAVDASGNVVICDNRGEQVRAIAVRAGRFYAMRMRAGDIYTVAGSKSHLYSGDGGPVAAAELVPFNDGVAADAAGDTMIAEGQSPVRMVAGTSGRLFGRAMTAGDIYSIAGGGNGPLTNGIPATKAGMNARTLTIDKHRNLVISDADNELIRVVAARTGTFYGQAMTAGDVYTVAGDGASGFSGDGGPAVDAKLSFLGIGAALAVDQAGNLVVVDNGNNRARVVAAATGMFYGQAMTAGHIYTVAGDGTAGFSGDGHPAVDAALSTTPFSGIAVDQAGNLVLGDAGNNRARVIAATTGTFYGQAMTAGDIYTVAGDGNSAFSGDGDPATAAGLSANGVAVDSHGNLAIADPRNNRVRVVAATTGTFYGQAMTAGDIYTVAGDGNSGFSGDGGPAIDAELGGVVGDDWLAVDKAGDLLISDNGRIRSVAGA